VFKTRLLSGIVLMILALLTIISGGYVLWATLFLVSVIGLTEIYKVSGVQKEGFSVLALIGAMGVLAYFLLLLFKLEAYSMMSIIFILIALMFVYVFTYPKYHADQVMAAFFGVSVFYLRAESDDPTTQRTWMDMAYAQEDTPAYVPQKARPVSQPATPAGDGGTVFDAVLHSKGFQELLRNAVLDTLRSPEGQDLLAQAIRKELSRR